MATAALRQPVIRDAIDMLALPAGSRGLDAGCGIGDHTRLLAESVGPDGLVTGLDLSPEVLAYAETHAGGAGVDFQQGDVNALPFDDETFDWAWSVDCVGHVSVGDPPSALRELTRVVRRGGTVAILLYSSQVLLPGFPGLEARLNATDRQDTRPEAHFLRASGWFRASGADVQAHTLTRTVAAPFGDADRQGLLALIRMLWGEDLAKLSREDQAEFDRLTDPRSPDYILAAPDYCGFFTYSMFCARLR